MSENLIPNVQIAVLRALRPNKFKTPGTQVNIGTKGDVFTLSEEQRHELQRINRDWLLTSSAKALEQGALAQAVQGAEPLAAGT